MNLDYDFVLNYAKNKHAGQFRADGITPYIEHPIKVAEIVKKFKRSKNINAIVLPAIPDKLSSIEISINCIIASAK